MILEYILWVFITLALHWNKWWVSTFMCFFFCILLYLVFISIKIQSVVHRYPNIVMWGTLLHFYFTFLYTILAVHLLYFHSLLINILGVVFCKRSLPHPGVFSSSHVLFRLIFSTLIILSPTHTYLPMWWTKRTS